MREADDWQKWTGIGITTCEREADDWQKSRKIVKSSKCPKGRQTLHAKL